MIACSKIADTAGRARHVEIDGNVLVGLAIERERLIQTVRGIKHQIDVAYQSPGVDCAHTRQVRRRGIKRLRSKRSAIGAEIDQAAGSCSEIHIGRLADRNGRAVGDTQRPAAIPPDIDIAAVGPRGAGAVDRNLARRAGRRTDVAVGIADGRAASDTQRPAAGVADEEAAAVGPRRAGAVDRDLARRAGIVADVAAVRVEIAATVDLYGAYAEFPDVSVRGSAVPSGRVSRVNVAAVGNGRASR